MSITTLSAPNVPTTLSADDVETHLGFDHWGGAVSATIGPLECQTQEPVAFRGEIVNRSVGDFQFARITAAAHRVVRTRRMIALNDSGLLKVCLQIRGSARIRQDGREAEVLPGDIAMCDTSRPYVISFDHNDDDFDLIVFLFPQAMMSLPSGAVRQLTATRVSGAHGLGLLVSPFLLGIAEAAVRDQSTFNARLAAHAVSLLETIFRERIDRGRPERAATSRLAIIQAWLERHLSDPALSPDLVARSHYISVRYLHRLFAAEGTSVSRWVKERRLEGARGELADPALVRCSVGSIAARWGMHDAASFSRAFRAAYGVSPREYRLRALGMGPAAPGAKAPSPRSG